MAGEKISTDGAVVSDIVGGLKKSVNGMKFDLKHVIDYSDSKAIEGLQEAIAGLATATMLLSECATMDADNIEKVHETIEKEDKKAKESMSKRR